MSHNRFTPYKNALKTLSARTGAPLPSLILSFAILHELTAVVPLVVVFYGSRTLGIGEGIVNAVAPSNTIPGSEISWPRKFLQGWVAEGDAWATRVGRRYGVFGFEKRIPGTSIEEVVPSLLSSHIAGDVANAIVAYGVTKVNLAHVFALNYHN